jgi:hypothetical protein
VAQDTLTSKKDHDRGCQGRTYTCTCGYDEQRDAEIERLERDLAEANEAYRSLVQLTARRDNT